MQEQRNLLEEFGIDTLPKEDQEGVIAELSELLFSGVVERAWDQLDLDKQDVLTSLLKDMKNNPNDEKSFVSLMQFLGEHLPELDEMVSKEIDKIKQRYSEVLSELQ